MIRRLAFFLVISVILIVPWPPLQGSPIQQIPPGGDVFIGEEGLNLTGIASGTTVSWYGGSQVVGSGSPSAIQAIGNASDFFVAPSQFSGRTGPWYIGNTTQIGFVVNNPFQAIFAFDQNSSNDVTDRSVPPGHFLTFRIDTNMNIIPIQRPGSDGFISIKVRTPDGTIYTSLLQDPETRLNLTDLAPDAIPWYWVPLENMSRNGWSTGLIGPDHDRIYPEGRYTFWTESNLNGMKDNYRAENGDDLAGRTVSAARNVTLANSTVRISAANTSIYRSQPFSVTITGKPGNAYYLWVAGTGSMSGLAGDQPPSIVQSQDGVRTDPKGGPWPIGRYVFQGSTKTIQQDVPQKYGTDAVKGTRYYALVTLSDSGTRTVGFSTTKNTKEGDYNIRVERPEPYDPPASDSGPNRTFRSGKVKIAVKKGGVEEGVENEAPKPATPYTLGDEIILNGTNTESDFTYLFISGPNLPPGGGQMTDPRTPVEPDSEESITRVDVVDSYWEYKWVTAGLNIDGGTYTVYAIPSAANKSMLADTGFDEISLTLRKPFVSAGVSAPVVAAGDPLDIQGTASGQPVDGLAVWVFGRNKVIYMITNVNDNSTFSQQLPGSQTAGMAPGQYFVVVQHPMYNQRFDVRPASSAAGSGNPDFVVGSYPEPDSPLFALEGPGSLQGPDAAGALTNALDNPDIDDTYAKNQFLVEEPEIRIRPTGDRQAGDTFNISGSTNLATGDDILVEVVSSSFGPAEKTRNHEFYGATGTVQVRKGTGDLNTWSFPVNTSLFAPDEYIVSASGLSVDVSASDRFNLTRPGPGAIGINAGPGEGSGISTASNGSVQGQGEIDRFAADAGDNEDSMGGTGISIGVKRSSMVADMIKPDNITVTTPATMTTVSSENVSMPAQRDRVPPAGAVHQPGFSSLTLLIGLAGSIAIFSFKRS